MVDGMVSDLFHGRGAGLAFAAAPPFDCLMITKSGLRLHQRPGVIADPLDGLQDRLHVTL